MVGTPTLIALLTSSAEVLLRHLPVLWHWTRWLPLSLSLYGLLWLVASWVTERVWPHQVVGDALVLCWLFDKIRLPLASIQELRIELVASAKGRNGLLRDSERAFLAVDGRTDASMTLTDPAVGLRYCTATRPFRMVPVAVDDPEHLQRVLSRTRSVPYTDCRTREALCDILRTTNLDSNTRELLYSVRCRGAFV